MEITIDQVRDLIKAEKVKPSDLFGADVLAEDASVKGLVETETRRAVAGEYAHRKRTEEGFDKTRGELEKQLAERTEKIKALETQAAKGKVGDLFAKQKEARKLDERQAKFVQKRIDKFSPQKIEDLDKEFNAYLDAELDEYDVVAKEIFGVTGEKPTNDPPKPTGAEPTNDSPTGDGPSKYLDPAQNPFIKTE